MLSRGIEDGDTQYYWLKHKDNHFTPAYIVKRQDEQSTFKFKLPDKNSREQQRSNKPASYWDEKVVMADKDVKDLEYVYPDQLQMFADIEKLQNISNGAVLETVRGRYNEQRKIYTAVDGVVIAVNPYKRLPIYGPKVMEKYENEGRTKTRSGANGKMSSPESSMNPKPRLSSVASQLLKRTTTTVDVKRDLEEPSGNKGRTSMKAKGTKELFKFYNL